MKSQERRDNILVCAARLFAAARFDEVLMEDIAREASVAKGTLYSHFADKDALYFAVVFDGILQLNNHLRAAAAQERLSSKIQIGAGHLAAAQEPARWLATGASNR